MGAAAVTRPDRRGAAIAGATALAIALASIYLLWQPQTLDLAAQTFRADLWDRYGWVVYNTSWYGGHTVPGYSLLYPPLGALLGPAVLGAVCAVAATALFAAVGTSAYGNRAWLGSAWFALGATANLLCGRTTFALGMVFGLAAVLALQRRRPGLGALAGIAAALSSPVAGLFTALAAAAVILADRLQPVAAPSRAALTRAAWVIAIAAVAASVILALAFPTSGYQPFTTASFLPIPLVCLACFLALPVGETNLRCGIVLYALVAIAAFAVTTPFGGNAVRLGTIFAGPVMALALYGRRPLVLLLLAAPLLWWQWAATVRDVRAADGDPATEAAFYAPLVTELEARSEGGPIRVDIPPTRSRWESVYVAEHVPLARGWLRQLESDDFELFTRGRITDTSYAKWLGAHGVDYVAVPRTWLDYLGNDEAELIRDSPPAYLRYEWSNADWALWRVEIDDDALRPTTVGPDGFTVEVPGAGRYQVRMRWSSYLEIVSGVGCIEPGETGTTILTVPTGAEPQEVEVKATFGLDGLLRRDPSCAGASSATPE